MKMIFNNLADCPALSHPVFTHLWAIFIFLSLFTPSIYADVTVNKLEKNDKIAGNGASLHGLSLQKGINEQAVSMPDTAGPRSVGTNDTSKAWELHAEQWELTRSGESVLSLPVLNQLINAWLLEKHRKIEVQYPGGEEGEFWVQELTDWLVSLGVPSNHMVIIPGSGADDMIKFGLIK